MPTAASTPIPLSNCPQTGTFPNTSSEPEWMPSRILGTKSPNRDWGNASGVKKSPTTHWTATSYGNVYYAARGDITRSTAKFHTADAKLDESVGLATTIPTTTTLSVMQTSKPLDKARDINRGVMS